MDIPALGAQVGDGHGLTAQPTPPAAYLLPVARRGPRACRVRASLDSGGIRSAPRYRRKLLRCGERDAGAAGGPWAGGGVCRGGGERTGGLAVGGVSERASAAALAVALAAAEPGASRPWGPGGGARCGSVRRHRQKRAWEGGSRRGSRRLCRATSRLPPSFPPSLSYSRPPSRRNPRLSARHGSTRDARLLLAARRREGRREGGSRAAEKEPPPHSAAPAGGVRSTASAGGSVEAKNKIWQKLYSVCKKMKSVLMTKHRNLENHRIAGKPWRMGQTWSWSLRIFLEVMSGKLSCLLVCMQKAWSDVTEKGQLPFSATEGCEDFPAVDKLNFGGEGSGKR
ncbi:uncharacterized protein ACIB01_003959 [Guaruba guarouba]